MRVFPMPGNLDEILLDGATALTLPSGMVMPLDRAFRVMDNAGGAGGANVTVTGPINGGASDTLTVNYQVKIYRWVGNGYQIG